MQNELRKKGRGADRAADGRSRHAVLRRLAGRGGDSAEQSNQIMSGVCWNWIKKRNYYQKKLPEYGDGYKQLPHYLPISIFPIYLKAKYIRARLKQYVCQD